MGPLPGAIWALLPMLGGSLKFDALPGYRSIASGTRSSAISRGRRLEMPLIRFTLTQATAAGSDSGRKNPCPKPNAAIRNAQGRRDAAPRIIEIGLVLG